VFETSRTNRVAVKTAVGQTERTEIPEIVTQGGTWGPMMCSNSIDTVGKFCQENGLIYKYKNISEIIPLAMVDDLLTISSCGYDTIEMNTTVNTLIELKKLKFHTPQEGKKSKCHSLHIGKPSKCCPRMKVHETEVDRVSEAMYLGDIITTDGKNSKNVKNRVSKGLGIVTEIMDTLNTVSFGEKYFEIAIILREARLINGILTNIEVWYGLQESEIKELEEVDKLLLRRVLQVPDSACIESLYLEVGLTPLRGIIKARRINHLHTLVRLEENEMLSKFFKAQWMHPIKNYWVNQVKEDLIDFDIDMDLEQVKKQSKNSFKKMVKKKMRNYALEYLNNLKEKHSKMENLLYIELKMQTYFKDKSITVQAAKNLFRWRTRAALFKMNYSNGYTNTACPCCQDGPDSQEHSFQCSVIQQKVNVVGEYGDIFNDDVSKDISGTILGIMNYREEISLT
jgi:hypothetical protein